MKPLIEFTSGVDLGFGDRKHHVIHTLRCEESSSEHISSLDLAAKHLQLKVNTLAAVLRCYSKTSPLFVWPQIK